MTPDKIIWTLMLFGVAPSLFVNRTATVVLFTFLLGYLGWRIGLPEPLTQFVLYVSACATGLYLARSHAQYVAMAGFAPLALTMILWLLGWLTAVESWNAAYWLTLMQLATVPFGNDWKGIGIFVRKVALGIQANRMEMILEPIR